MASPIDITVSSNEPFLKHGLGLLRAHARLVMLALGGFMLVALLGGGAMAGWFGPSLPSDTLLVLGDIEAHESLLSFKTVQSRIVLLVLSPHICQRGQIIDIATKLLRSSGACRNDLKPPDESPGDSAS